VNNLLHSYGYLNDAEKIAALVFAWYLQALDDVELRRRAHELLKSGRGPSDTALEELVKKLEVDTVSLGE